jgi:hypothetical protein
MTRALRPLSILVALASLAACGGELTPTATVVELRHALAVVEVSAPEGTRIAIDGDEARVDASGRLRMDVSVEHYSETPRLPRVDIRAFRDALIGGAEAYLSVELPLPVATIRALPTPEQGFVLLGTSSSGANVAAVPGATLEVQGRPVELDRWGTGMARVELLPLVLASPPTLLVSGGTVDVPVSVVRDGVATQASIPMSVTSEAAARYVAGWVESGADRSVAPSELGAGIFWQRDPRIEQRAPSVLVGAPATLATRFAAVETTTDTELRRCQGGFPLVRRDRVVVLRDLQSGEEVARRTFVTPRPECPAVFTLSTRAWYSWPTSGAIESWLSTELARRTGR